MVVEGREVNSIVGVNRLSSFRSLWWWREGRSIALWWWLGGSEHGGKKYISSYL